MNMFKLVTLFATSLLLASCASVTAKNSVSGKVLADVEESDVVIVADARTVDKVTETNEVNNSWKKTTHNWNTANGEPTVPAIKEPTVNNTPTTIPTTAIESSSLKIDKSTRLFVFFFSMMLMGMLGAGIIGLIESISGRNSLDTTPSTPPQKTKK